MIRAPILILFAFPIIAAAVILWPLFMVGCLAAEGFRSWRRV